MRFRQQSELGWLMLEWLGALCMPSVTRDAVLGTLRVRHQGRREGMSAGLAHSVMDGSEQTITRTYDGRESFWWLSYADDHRCAGVAIVRVTGEQSAKHAADVARALGLTPAGDWQVMGIQVPEEERALAERFAGRFLTIAEAESAFAAQSIKSFEAQNPDVSLDFGSAEIVE